jgi:non-ribosomal peptide synthase protein (TIGR01720 family)
LATDLAYIRVCFGQHRTLEWLEQSAAAYRTEPQDLLLTALARVLCRVWELGSCRVDLEVSQRGAFDALDTRRTLGQFSATYPVRLAPPSAAGEAGLGRDIQAIKEQLRSVPDQGLGYALLRHLGEPVTRLALERLPAAPIGFRFSEQAMTPAAAVALWHPVSELSWRGIGHLEHGLELSAAVRDGALELVFDYRRDVHADSAVEALAALYQAELEALIEHCVSQRGATLTPSDVVGVSLDQAALDDLLEGIA